MPKRDEHEYEERRQQIISGALTVFAEKGFEKATNRDIARAAGIGSPGLIYHYFKDKADLLRQVIESRSPGLQLISHSEALMQRPPHEVLTMLGNAFMSTLLDDDGLAMFRLVLGEALRQPAVAHMLNDLVPLRVFAFLTRYFEAQMDAGLLRRTDAGAAARCFVGPLLIYVLSRGVFYLPDLPTLAPGTMLAVTVETFLAGMGYQFAAPEKADA